MAGRTRKKTRLADPEPIILTAENPIYGPLTLGLELELALVAKLPSDLWKRFQKKEISILQFHQTRNGATEDLRTDLHRDLNSAGIAASLSADDPQDDYDTSKWNVTIDSSIEDWHIEFGDYKTFELIDGTTIYDDISTDPNYPMIVFTDVELRSRVLTIRNPSTVRADVWPELRTVLNVVHTKPAMVSDGTGFHVHVGNGNQGFKLHTLKNLLMLLIICQFQLDQVHPGNRILSDMCWPLSSCIPSDERQVWKIARMIENLQTVEEFVNFVHKSPGVANYAHNKHASVSFVHLMRDFKTIEFRQHKGTLDAAEIHRWILLVTGLVWVSHSSKLAFSRIFHKVGTWEAASVEHYSFLELLGDLGLGFLVPKFQVQLYMHGYDHGTPFDRWEDNIAELREQQANGAGWQSTEVEYVDEVIEDSSSEE